jgi:hypothetical protein
MEYFMSKLAKLESYLVDGGVVTAKQIKSMFKLANPTAAVSELRRRGVAIYSNPATLYTGEKTTKYRVGTPSKAMVAAAFAAGFAA